MTRLTAVMPIVVLALVASTILVSSTPASAHEHREVGEYEFTVGFNVEPALVNQPNALFLHVSIHEPVPEGEEPPAGEGEEEGTPVEGLEETLEAEIIAGGGATKMPLALEAAFGDPGVYLGNVIPTVTGDYSFRIFGDIEGEPVDETFSSGPETFSPVEETSDLQFPEKVPSNADLEASIDGLSEQIAGLDSGGSDSDIAMILAIIGIVAGVIGIGVGGLAIAQRRS